MKEVTAFKNKIINQDHYHIFSFYFIQMVTSTAKKKKKSELESSLRETFSQKEYNLDGQMNY